LKGIQNVGKKKRKSGTSLKKGTKNWAKGKFLIIGDGTLNGDGVFRDQKRRGEAGEITDSSRCGGKG